MEQQSSSLAVPLLIVAVLAAGGYFFFTRSAGDMHKEEKAQMAVTAPLPASAGETAEAPAKMPDATGDINLAASAIITAAEGDPGADDAEAEDATLVTNDSAEINSYGDSYDTTDF